MGVKRLGHVAVTVSDMDAAVAFWSTALELPLRGRGVVRHAHLDRITGLPDTEIEWAEITVPGGSLIELFRYVRPEGSGAAAAAPNDPGAAHICLEVEGLDAVVARLSAAGFRARSPEPVRIPTGDWVGWRDVYVESPDGVILELSEPPPAVRHSGRSV